MPYATCGWWPFGLGAEPLEAADVCGPHTTARPDGKCVPSATLCGAGTALRDGVCVAEVEPDPGYKLGKVDAIAEAALMRDNPGLFGALQEGRVGPAEVDAYTTCVHEGLETLSHARVSDILSNGLHHDADPTARLQANAVVGLSAAGCRSRHNLHFPQ